MKLTNSSWTLGPLWSIHYWSKSMRSKNRSTINFKKGKKTSITDTGHRSTDAISNYGISSELMAIVRHARLEAGWYDWNNSIFIHEHRTTQFLKELTRICESKGWLKYHLAYLTQLANSVSLNLEIFGGGWFTLPSSTNADGSQVCPSYWRQ